MATATTPQYIQQAFNWDETEASPTVTKAIVPESHAKNQPRPARKSQPMTVPTFTTTTSARRGRCEHVGGILASVLERYGIGIDQLIAEIDGLR